MPPPARPQSARPVTLAYRPPPPPSTPRRVVGARFDDDELDPDQNLFHVSPLAPYEYPPAMPPMQQRIRRPSVGAASAAYDTGSYRTEVAGRRSSYLGRHSISSNSDFEEKMRMAQAYQEDVSGGPQMPLTAETLRKASKNGGSSRSTRSSGSHDESDYRNQSATTRTTRSSNNNEESYTTIHVKGARMVEVDGAKMHCDNGAEINISKRAPANSYRDDRSSYADQEDGRRIVEDLPPRPRGRIDMRPPTRTRSGSQSGSYARTPSRYETAPIQRYDSQQFDAWGYPLGPPYSAYAPPPPQGNGYI